jgi:hypothetical protein
VALAVLTLGLVACGDTPGPESGPNSAVSTQARSATGGPRGSDAVSAVRLSEGAPVAELEFVIDSRPVAGKPFHVKLQVSAAAPVPALQLAAESTSLIVAPASATLAIESADQPAVQDLTVTAPAAGLLELGVRLKSGDAPETLYSIPVLVAAAEAG